MEADHDEAARLFREAIQAKGPNMAYEAARFFDGHYAGFEPSSLVHIDRAEAARLYEIAMKAGIDQAQVPLAMIHLTRDIPGKNVEYGKELLRRAAAGGQKEALAGIDIHRVIEVLNIEKPLKGFTEKRLLRGRSVQDFEFDADKLLMAAYDDLTHVLDFMLQIREDPFGTYQGILEAMDRHPGGAQRLAVECKNRRALVEIGLKQRDCGMNDNDFVTYLHQIASARGRKKALARIYPET